MSRQCKCQICGKKINTSEAYKIQIKNKNKYYCSEEEYQKDLWQKQAKDQCFNTILEIMNIPFVTPMMKKELNNLNKFYDFNIIENTFKRYIKQIQWFLNNNNSSSEYGKTRYIMTIIQNNINAVATEIKNIHQEREKELNNTNKVDVDIINLSQCNTSQSEVSDISKWLD